ncbi:EpsD family peptidyl-prolyl cis-trans isomerase [Phenylobacterium sp.]|uniref:EpsD family peptidyl-prolyl cis-trans isomerase n=1 Tax=Phenylobacterium sp. TaxID=1871053 RepID=UPI00286C1B55|nr:EpsD family peptidyl-prolyl cis-trans isomerase [Phenylobacterium sp.]
MKLTWTHGAALFASVAISGCGLGGDKAPTGQVVATVDGEEITVMELNAELNGVQVTDAVQRKAVEQAALERIVLRKLLVQSAKADKMDKTPAFSQQVDRATENLLAGMMQRKMAQGVADPPRAEAERFVASQPGMFANRRVMVVDQIVTATISPEIVKQLEPTKTLEQVEAVFQGANLDYQRNTVVLDTLSAPPAFVDTLSKLPPGEIFVFPRPGAVIVNQIRDSRAVPFTGDRAIKYAMAGLKTLKTQEAVSKKMEILQKSSASKVIYNDAYKPKPAAKAPASKAPAAKSAAPTATPPAPVASPAPAAPPAK